jgi:hypothetical protein
MDEDEEMAELEEWLAILKASKDDDFRVHARPYFDDTQTLNVLWENDGRDAVENVIQEAYKGKHRSVVH